MKSRTIAQARYSTELLARVGAGWKHLSDRERQGVITAARLAAELTALGAPPAVLAMAARVVQDEVRHVEVCARVLEALEVSAPARLELALSMPRNPNLAAGNEARVARTLVSAFALGKPVVAASFAAARAIVREPLLAWAYTELLHDEPRHATFGAKAAAWVIRHWSPRQRQALWTECLTSSETSGAAHLRDTEAESLGLLPAEPDGALPRWILPHLAPLGVIQRPSNDQALVH